MFIDVCRTLRDGVRFREHCKHHVGHNHEVFISSFLAIRQNADHRGFTKKANFTEFVRDSELSDNGCAGFL